MEVTIISHLSPIDEMNGSTPPIPDEYKFVVVKNFNGVQQCEVGPSEIMGEHADCPQFTW